MEYDYRFDESGSPAGCPVDCVTRYMIMAIGVVVLLYGVGFWLSAQPPFLEILLASLLVAVFLVSYFAVIWTFAHVAELVYSLASVMAMTVLLGDEFSWLTIPVAGLAVLYLPAVRGVAVVVLTTGVTVALLLSDQLPCSRVATYVLSAVLYSSIYFLVGALSEHSAAMVRTQGKLAREAVVEERLRFSQELHDVLGHSLSVINAKTELAMRLRDRDPEAAWGEMTSLRHLSRRSIADVRRVVYGYRMSSLASEVAAASALLSSGGVRVVADEVPAALPTEAEEAFCWVVRSAATNILQHARAGICSLEFSLDRGWASIRVTNDGVIGFEGEIVENEGNGLPGLRQRLSQAGGTLHHSRPTADTFSIEAAVPLNRSGEIACQLELSSPRTKS